MAINLLASSNESHRLLCLCWLLFILNKQDIDILWKGEWLDFEAFLEDGIDPGLSFFKTHPTVGWYDNDITHILLPAISILETSSYAKREP